MTRISLCLALVLATGCVSSDRRDQDQDPIVTPAPWSLTTDPTGAYDEAHRLIAEVVELFDRKWSPVTKKITYVGTPGWRY